MLDQKYEKSKSKIFWIIIVTIIFVNFFYLTVLSSATTKMVASKLVKELQLNEKQTQRLFIEVAPSLDEPWTLYYLINTLICIGALFYLKKR